MVETIKHLCASEKLSLNDLEKRIDGVGENTIYRWDKSAPNVLKVVAVADYFGVSVDFLVGRESHSNAEETALIAKFRRLTPSQKETILSNIDFLLSQIKKEAM